MGRGPGRFFAVVLVLGAWGAAGPAAAEPPFREPLQGLRSAQGLSLPDLEPVLTQSAQSRAEALAAAGVLSHEDDQGRGPGLQLTATGYAPGEFGEVLGAGADPGAVWTAWLASPGHRAVLDAPGWTAWGAGSAPRGATTVWVLRFWKP